MNYITREISKNFVVFTSDCRQLSEAFELSGECVFVSVYFIQPIFVLFVLVIVERFDREYIISLFIPSGSELHRAEHSHTFQPSLTYLFDNTAAVCR